MVLMQHKLVENLTAHPLLGMSGMMDSLLALENKRSKTGAADKKATHAERAEELSLKWDGLKADIAARGILEPLKVCVDGKKWLIVDGRHRWVVARELGLSTVPCILVKASEAKQIILSAMQGKHLSKGARAYTALSIYPEVALESGKGKQMGTECPFDSQSDLAEKIGISHRLVKIACSLYRIFHEHPYLKGKYEQGVFTCKSLNHVKGDMENRVIYHAEHGTYEYKQPDKKTAEEKAAIELTVKKSLVKDRFVAMRDFNKEVVKDWDVVDDEVLGEIKPTFGAFLDELHPLIRDFAIQHLSEGGVNE